MLVVVVSFGHRYKALKNTTNIGANVRGLPFLLVTTLVGDISALIDHWQHDYASNSIVIWIFESWRHRSLPRTQRERNPSRLMIVRCLVCEP